ncbi:MAG: GntR family transcriptional regulator [Pseudomonadota bacterium]
MDSKKIHEILRNKIIHLEMEPEHIINVSDLAASFGISRTPIKEALILLQGEGWLLRHGSHFMVTPLSIKRLRDNVEIRLLMEPPAYVWAMQRMTEADHQELMALEREMRQLSPEEPARSFGELDQRFHETLLKATNNQELYVLLSRVIGQCLRCWLSPIEKDKANYFNTSYDIIDALRKGDAERLKEAAAEHIKMSLLEVKLL